MPILSGGDFNIFDVERSSVWSERDHRIEHPNTRPVAFFWIPANQATGTKSIHALFVLLDLLERYPKSSHEVFLAHFDLIAAGPNTFADRYI